MYYNITEDTIIRFKEERKTAQKKYESAISKNQGYLEAYWKGKLDQINYVLGMIKIDKDSIAKKNNMI